jgi:hydrogenase/urease accessory protein HupE
MIIRRLINTCAPALFARRLILAALIHLLLLAPAISEAHGPFDNSIHATLRADVLEVSVSLGGEASKEILNRASPKNLAALGGMGLKTLPNELAAHFIEIKSGTVMLVADNFTVVGDGLEYSFTATYPKPASSTLVFRAPYFDVLEQMKLGTLVLTDDARKQIGSGLLTKGSSTVELNLPQPAAPAVVATEPSPAPSTTIATLPPAPGGNVITLAPQRPSFARFLHLGIEHILTGYDHLLFLCALLVACQRIKPMLAIITCFTVAHSVTLGLAALDVVQISSRIIEPLIAASIIFVGVENFRGNVDVKLRCGVTLVFGLIHGFGFAGALRESGLAGQGAELLSPLLAFNLGVELGQLAVAAVFLPLLFLARRMQAVERFATPAVSAVVIALGSFWLVQRLFS